MKRSERNLLANAKRNRRKGAGEPRPGRSRGSAILADRAPAAGPDTGAEYADFVRQRKGDLARSIREQRERSLQIADGIADARIRRAFLQAEAQHERDLADFWRRFFRRVRKQAKTSAGASDNAIVTDLHRSSPRPALSGKDKSPPSGAIQLARYSGPVLDRRGRRGVYLSATYLGAKTDPGCARRLVRYATDPDHVEWLDGVALVGSNVGDTRAEMSAAFGLVEDLNRAARANAKIVFHLIVQLPHDVLPADRAAIMRRWCDDQFGTRNLPYVWAVHTPDAEGDQRNCHGHVAVSFRPLARVAPFTWDAAREVRTELDSPAQFRVMRGQFARVMTEVAQEAGKQREYTALSHAARGLKIKPTEHLGAQKARIVREGGYVAADARNRARISRNEAMLGIEKLKRRKAAMERRLAVVRRIQSSSVDTVHAIVRGRRPSPPRVAQPGSSVRPSRPRQHLAVPAVAAGRPRDVQAPDLRPAVAARASGSQKIGVAAITVAPRPNASTRPASATFGAVERGADQTLVGVDAGARIHPDASATPRILAMPAADRPAGVGAPVVIAAPSSRPTAAVRSVAGPHNAPHTSTRPTVSVATVTPVTSSIRPMGTSERSLSSARARRPAAAVSAAASPVPTRVARPALTNEGSPTIIPVVKRAPISVRQPTPLVAISPTERPAGSPSGVDEVLLQAMFGEQSRHRRARAKAGAPSTMLAASARIDWSAATQDVDVTFDRIEALDLVAPLTAAPMTAITKRVRKADIYVHDDGAGRLGLDPRAVVALRTSDAALDDPAEQAPLADLRREQQRVMAALISEAVRRPLAFDRTGPRPWPRDLAPEMLVRLDRWSRDEGFQQELPVAIERRVAAAHRLEAERLLAMRSAADREVVAAKNAPATRPDGFGGTRSTRPPVHVAVAAPGVRIAPRDIGTGAPSRQLLLLARLAGERPALIDRASDGRLTTLRGTPTLAAALVDLWRHDGAVDQLITRIVTDSRSAGRPVWPADIAAALGERASATTRRPSPDHSRGPQR